MSEPKDRKNISKTDPSNASEPNQQEQRHRLSKSQPPKDQERVHKFLSEDLGIRASSVIATSVVEEMRGIQQLYPIPAVAVGRATVGALLMASHLKDSQQLSLYFRGNGPLESIFAEANFEGQTRAFTANPNYAEPISGEKIIIGHAIGIGLLTVTHHLPMQDQPHRGTVIIRSGEIGDDLAFYLDQSHQIPSVVALGVHIDTYGRVTAAGGILIELMPGHTEQMIEKIEARVRQAEPISKRILEGASATDLINDYLQDFKLLELEHNYPIEYQCRCNDDRMKRSLMLLGVAELDSMIVENKPLDVSCEFCGRKYQVSVDEQQKIRNEVFRQTLN